METFRYRLQTLLDRKAELKENAERELAAARQKLREAEARLAAARDREQALDADRAARRRALLTGESGGDEVRRRVSDLALVGRRIEEARDEVMSLRLHTEESKEQVDHAAVVLAGAVRELEVLNKHRAKGERRFRAELERKDAAVQDEIASALFARRRA
jgi:flagellar biosynthesis chaperone FliJ